MSILRKNALVRGPAIVKFSWTTGSGNEAVDHAYVVRTAGDVTFTPELQTFDVPSAEYGRIDRRATERMGTVSFTPVGVIDSDGVALFWPHLTMLPGQSLFADWDMKVEIVPVAGAVAAANDNSGVTVYNACISRMPVISMTPTATTIGEVSIRGVVADGLSWTAASHWALDAANAPTLSALDPATIPTLPAKLAWGDMTDIKTQSGVVIDFEMQTQDEVEDETGIYDITLTDLSATARFTPVGGFDMEALQELLGGGADVLRGAPVPRANLTATSMGAGGLIVSLFGCSLLSAPMTYGATARRLGELSLSGMRGTGNAIGTIAIATSSTAATRGPQVEEEATEETT